MTLVFGMGVDFECVDNAALKITVHGGMQEVHERWGVFICH